MLSGVKAQIAIKLYGDNLDTLRRQAERIKNAIADVDGVRHLQVEQQTNIPQLRIEGGRSQAGVVRLAAIGRKRIRGNGHAG